VKLQAHYCRLRRYYCQVLSLSTTTYARLTFGEEALERRSLDFRQNLQIKLCSADEVQMRNTYVVGQMDIVYKTDKSLQISKTMHLFPIN